MRDEIRKLALANAIKFNGKASDGAVVGRFLGLHPDKKDAATMQVIREITAEVNKLSLEEQKAQLEKLGPIEEVKKKPETFELPDLQNVQGKVVMRMAPNPNGPLHIGHARQFVLNALYAQKYNGELILRFDDTDPKNKIPLKEAYEWIIADLKWLGINPNKIVYQSDRLETYYQYAERFVKEGHAYVCYCEAESKSAALQKKESCPCREKSVEDQLKAWKQFLHKDKEGSAVLRIKTDLNHKNPAARDWPAFRIIDNPKHPRVKGKHVWPLLNFASSIDDYEFGVTHILRGIDLQVSDERQVFIYNFLGKSYPQTVYTGKFDFQGVKSTSMASEMIKNRELTGWDDIRLGTLMALRRRGILPQTIIHFIREAGVNKGEIMISPEKIAAFNRQLIDKQTDRYFFIASPKKVKIKKSPHKEVKVPFHPDVPERGYKTFNTGSTFLIADDLQAGKTYRLMHLFNIRDGAFVSEAQDPALHAQLIHWLPVQKENVKVEILMPDGSIAKGVGEPALANLAEGTIVQFYRFGFAKLDKKAKSKLVFWLAHE